MKEHAFYVTTADPSDAFSNHWLNAPEDNSCPNCGEENSFVGKVTLRNYDRDTRSIKKSVQYMRICRNCWNKY